MYQEREIHFSGWFPRGIFRSLSTRSARVSESLRVWESEKEIRTLEQQLRTAENRRDNLLNALADNILPAEAIKTQYGAGENKAHRLRHKLGQIQPLQRPKPIDLTIFRQLLRLQQEDTWKAAMTGLVAKIEAHPGSKNSGGFLDWRSGDTNSRRPRRGH